MSAAQTERSERQGSDEEASAMRTPAGEGSAVAPFLLLPRLILTVLVGWGRLVVEVVRLTIGHLRGLPFCQLVFLVSCLALFLTGAPAWVSYQVDFSTQETVRNGSAFRTMCAPRSKARAASGEEITMPAMRP